MIENLGGVRNLSVYPQTGSVLVEFDPKAFIMEELTSLARLARVVGEIGGAVEGEDREPEPFAWNEISVLAKRIQSGFYRANRSVGRVTGGLADLRFLSRCLCCCLESFG